MPERERLLGFPQGYTRGFTNTVATAMLGDSFHVGTVAHLLGPVAKQLPPAPVVLSVFDGIGAARLALAKLGVRPAIYIAVEIDPDRRRLVRNVWDDQRDGLLVQLADVRDLAVRAVEAQLFPNQRR